MTDGDRARFEGLMLPHLDAAYALAYWLTHNEDEARDAVQEAFLRALRFFASFRGDDGRGWLLKIVRNACHELRDRERHAAISGELDEDSLAPDRIAAGVVVPFPRNPEAAAIERAGAEAVRAHLRALAPEYREVLVLRELHGLSYREIAAIAAIPPGTVMSRLARGRKLLAARISAVARYEETGT